MKDKEHTERMERTRIKTPAWRWKPTPPAKAAQLAATLTGQPDPVDTAAVTRTLDDMLGDDDPAQAGHHIQRARRLMDTAIRAVMRRRLTDDVDDGDGHLPPGRDGDTVIILTTDRDRVRHLLSQLAATLAGTLPGPDTDATAARIIRTRMRELTHGNPAGPHVDGIPGPWAAWRVMADHIALRIIDTETMHALNRLTTGE